MLSNNNLLLFSYSSYTDIVKDSIIRLTVHIFWLIGGDRLIEP